MIFFALVTLASVLLIAVFVFGTIAANHMDQTVGIRGYLANRHYTRAAAWALAMVVAAAGLITVVARLFSGAWLA